MSKVLLLLLGVASALCLLQSSLYVSACSCLLRHPQDNFCFADFVIKAHVRKVRMVDLRTDGSVRVQKTKGQRRTTGEVTRPKGPAGRTEEAMERLEWADEEDLVRPAPVIVPGSVKHKARVKLNGPDTWMPGHRPRNTGIREREAVAVHAPGISDSRSFRSLREKRAALKRPRVVFSRSRKRHAHQSVGLAPGSAYVHEIPSRPMLEYKIDIVKVYKGLENVTKKGRDYLYTVPPPLCYKNLTTSTYVLMGRLLDGVMRVNLCDYAVRIDDSLDEDERKNLARNLRYRFHKGCRDCEIKRMTETYHPKKLNPYTCLWEDPYRTDIFNVSQSACMRCKAGKCKWYNPVMKKP